MLVLPELALLEWFSNKSFHPLTKLAVAVQVRVWGSPGRRWGSRRSPWQRRGRGGGGSPSPSRDRLAVAGEAKWGRRLRSHEAGCRGGVPIAFIADQGDTVHNMHSTAAFSGGSFLPLGKQTQPSN